jgi:NADPH-dependent 2,4-dienoyl-CoA reductase/sulfur reductase-like enzyme
MPHYTYLIIGGGMTAGAAIEGIREADALGSVGVIGADSHPPYDRPPLSKGLWKGKSLDTIWRKIEPQDVTLHLGRKARTLEPHEKHVTDDRGTVYTYDKLLLATGGAPRRFLFGGDDIIYFRTLDDYKRLRALTAQSQRIAVIGGGFIGSEVAAALTMSGKKVVMAFPGDGIGSRLFPADLSRFLNDFYREKGVDVLTGERVTGWEKRQGKPVLKTRNKQTQAERELSRRRGDDRRKRFDQPLPVPPESPSRWRYPRARRGVADPGRGYRSWRHSPAA